MLTWLLVAALLLLWIFAMPIKRKSKGKKRSPAKAKKRSTSSGSSYFSPEYQEFIRSDDWKKKRKQVIARDGGKCVKCGTRSRLEVNHRVYPSRTAGYQAFVKQPNSQLETLCHSCHCAHTAKTRRARR